MPATLKNTFTRQQRRASERLAEKQDEAKAASDRKLEATQKSRKRKSIFDTLLLRRKRGKRKPKFSFIPKMDTPIVTVPPTEAKAA